MPPHGKILKKGPVSVSIFWRQIEKKPSRNHQLIGIGQFQGEQRVFVDM
jgi:hypothetical protein